MLVTDDPIRRDIPHEEGEWMEFRRLSATQLNAARSVKAGEQQQNTGALMRSMGLELVEAFMDRNREQQDTIVNEMRRFEYDISNFDVPTLLGSGIIGWSYDAPPPESPADVLDERTAVWAAEQIIGIVKPPDEDAEGNSSPPSPAIDGMRADAPRSGI